LSEIFEKTGYLNVFNRSKFIFKHSSGQKSMCFAAKGRLQGRAAKLLLAGGKSPDIEQDSLTANGPLVE
jgi:hypothetical protein